MSKDVSNRHYNYPLILLLLLSALSFSLLAEEIDTVFVTALRVSESISRIPLSTYIINKDEISLRYFGNIGSVLNHLPVLDIRTYSLIGGVTSMSLLGSSSAQVLVLLDGRVINSPNLGVADLSLLPTDNLKKVEVVTGPISSLYGANALAGVINFVTKSPLDFTLPGVYYDGSFSYGTYKTNRINLETGFASNYFNILMALTHINSSGFRTNDASLKQGISMKLGYHNLNNNVEFDCNVQTKTKGLPGPKPAPNSIPRYGDSTASSIYDQSVDTVFSIKIDWKLTLNPKLSFQFIPNFSKNFTRFWWIDTYSVDTAIYQENYNTEVIGASLITDYQSPIGIRGVAGIDFKDDNFLSSSYLYDEITFGYKDTVWKTDANRIGVFGELNLPLCSHLILTSAARLDWNSDFGSFLSPSLGLLSPLSSQTRIRAHFGRAFRAPTFNDLYWPRSGNPNLKPEYGDALQFGIDWENFSLTGFCRKTKDLISWVPDKEGIWRPTNIDKSDIFGITTKGKFNISQNFSFRYGLNLSEATQTRREMVYSDWLTGKTEFKSVKRRAAYLPKFSATQELNYQYSYKSNFSLELRETGNRVNYYTSYDSIPKVYIAPKTLPFNFIINFRARQKLFEKTELRCRIENLLNRSYTEQFGNSLFDLDYPGPKRTIFLEIRFNNF